MADQAEIGGGANARPLNDTIAQTGPGIPDDPLGPGETLPEPVDDDEVERAKTQLERLSGD